MYKASSNEAVVFGNSISLIKNEILGKVIDENGKGIPYASVIIKGSTDGVLCDSSGNFYLRIPEKKKQVSLVASGIGYETAESVITTRSNLSQAITLKAGLSLNNEVVVIAMGYTRKGMVTGAMSVVKNSYLQRVKDYFAKDSFTVFPNPAKAGREIKIEWKKADAGDHLIDLYDSRGQLIQSRVTKIEAEGTNVNFLLPLITPGTYILRITNKKKGKKEVEKIIIQ